MSLRFALPGLVALALSCKTPTQITVVLKGRGIACSQAEGGAGSLLERDPLFAWDNRYPMYQHLFRAIRSEVRNHAQHLRSQRYQEPTPLSSLSSNDEKKPDAEPRVLTADDFPSTLPSPEDELEAKQRALMVEKIKCQVSAVLGHGSMGHRVFLLQLDELGGPQICPELKLTKRQYSVYNMQVVPAVHKIKKRVTEGAV